MYNMDTEEEAASVVTLVRLQLTSLEWSKMTRPRRSACHDLYQIYQVLSLHIPQWSSNDALIVWRRVSGRFIGPIK